MENRQGINRREFIQRTTAMGLAVGASNVAFTEGPRSVNDKITVGMIGVGARAHELLQAIQAAPGTEIVGVCDAYKGRLELADEPGFILIIGRFWLTRVSTPSSLPLPTTGTRPWRLTLSRPAKMFTSKSL